MTVVDAERVAWLEDRRTGIGGSDVAGVLGLSPWQSPWSVWADKVGLTPIDHATTAAQEFGLRAEWMLADWFHDRTGLHVEGAQTVVTAPGEPWMRCTVDGFVYPHAATQMATGVAEWKTTIEAPWEKVPDHYACQATWAMAVTGLPVCWFGVLHLAFGRPDFQVYEFIRDEDDVAHIVEVCRRFWFDHVVAGVPPATDGHPATGDALRDAFAPDPDLTVEATDANSRDLAVLAEAKRLARSYADEAAAIENSIKASMGDATTLTHNGRVVATWKPSTRTGFDTKQALARYPRALARYQTTTNTRTFLAKKQGD